MDSIRAEAEETLSVIEEPRRLRFALAISSQRRGPETGLNPAQSNGIIDTEIVDVDEVELLLQINYTPWTIVWYFNDSQVACVKQEH